MLKIGVSSCFFHADPLRPTFKGKTLLYLVQDVGDWLLANGAIPILLPTLPKKARFTLSELCQDLDGLVLQGGSDVAPQSYGETSLKPEWSGDAIRDRYEINLVHEFHRQGKPVLGLCRGLQLLNVAFGGSLYQDIATQCPNSLNHRDWEIYDQNFHSVELVEKSQLSALYENEHNLKGRIAKVNSVHHQAIKNLGKDFLAEAYSIPDRLIEAIRLKGDNYVVGVQWHPEFQDPEDQSLLSTRPLIDEFSRAAIQRKKN